VRFFVHEENVDEVRVTWEVKCIRRAPICRTLDLITKKEENAREPLACVNTPWTYTHGQEACATDLSFLHGASEFMKK